MEHKKIYLLFTKFPDNGSKIITFLKGCPYPHASIGFEEDLDKFYSFVNKGFIVESISRYIKPEREPFPCRLYELKVPEHIYYRIQNIINYFVEFKNIVHYSKSGVLLSLLHIPYKRNRFGFFCSQFVAYVLEQSGAIKLERQSQYYFSNDLANLPGVKLKFQGNLVTMKSCFG